LAQGSTVVDVGGGIGTQSLVLARAFPDLELVVQDREGVIPDGNKVRYSTSVTPFT
jgi:ubiquinone/menaquinone biosynthesis C-methylase UbiE